MKTTLSLSGGKDSTFLLLELIRRGTPPDECVFFDTGWEFPQMYRHMDRLRALCEENGIEFTVLHPAKSFDYLMFEKPVREKTGGTHCGYSWCGARGIRWGTTEKTKALDQHNKGNIVLIGIAADEPDRLTKERAPGKTFPLAEWGITEAECLAGCYAAGYDWEGLYEKLDRVSYAALLDLVTDICKRNGIKRLVWSTRKNDRVNHLNGCNMTVHRDYANKSCPGDYLYNRHGQIAAEVNKRLGITDAGGSAGGQTSGNTETGLKVGDVVDFKGTQHYTSAAAKDAKTCKPGKATITAIAAGKVHPYHLKAVSGGGSTVYGWVNAADISTGSTGTATSYRVRTTADVLNIRKGPGTNYGVAGQIKGKGIYTIVAEAAGPGATKWGKLKSGAGWISLDYVTKL